MIQQLCITFVTRERVRVTARKEREREQKKVRGNTLQQGIVNTMVDEEKGKEEERRQEEKIVTIIKCVYEGIH